MKNEIVKAWVEDVVIPTYEVGEPEKNPIFLEKRVYQGSSGSVYPHPVIEKIHDQKIDKVWKGVFIENQYIKMMILPELGGRIQMAYDKMKERHFVYYNNVIKPALVGLTGPWISGGIEFNWPQHHRPSTYDPVDFVIEENLDGSKTVWCSEVERMFRTKGMAGFTLHPDKAYIEIKAKLFNRTSQPQTFLWWANPAVAVNDDYQSVFPPDVNAVFDHGKRDVSKFPIATGTYYKMDYSAGVDISKYKNIPVPTSYMAIVSEYNFVGGYEEDTKGGLLHVANHHISPGKKQWTWGNGEFGWAWDRNLTDKDGPYIELMCGVYTDNQPDFSWLMPFEEKQFTQYFMPYRDLGLVKNATKDAMLNFEIKDGKGELRVYTTAAHEGVKAYVFCKGKKIFSTSTNLDPSTSLNEIFNISESAPASDYSVEIRTASDQVLVSWMPESEEVREIPDPARAAKPPKEITSIEQLYLTGLHIEQYRHATFIPTDYYLEALSRDPEDSRCNNAMGLWLLRKAKFEEANVYFRRAIKTLTDRNPNPYDGEALFNLGQSLKFQGKYKEAYDSFFKATWNAAWMDSAYFHLAQLEGLKGEFEEALVLVNNALSRNASNHKARHLKISLLRRLDRKEQAIAFAQESLGVDKFNFAALYELYILKGEEDTVIKMRKLMRDNIHNYIEYSIDYAQAGLFKEAIDFINYGIAKQQNVWPTALYLRAWFESQANINNDRTLEQAALANPKYCFPNRLEEIVSLEYAIEIKPEDGHAHYYLGNFWYHARQYNDAVSCWEKAIQLLPEFPTAHRNLALAYYNKLGKKQEALVLLEKAFKLDTSDARILMELDQLYRKLNVSLDNRLAKLNEYGHLTSARDDLYLEHISLKNYTGQFDEAHEMISNRIFHPWEGGEGRVTGQYMLSLVEMAKYLIRKDKFEEAIKHLEKSKEFPHNLGEGKLHGAQENDINYWLGCAHEGAGNQDLAKHYWELAAIGLSEPTAAWYYNDQQPDKILYQGLALQKLNRKGEAMSRFNKLIDYGEKHFLDEVKIDYFAVSLPDLLIWEEDLQMRNQIHCKYLMALGCLGKRAFKKSMEEFQWVLDRDAAHPGALIHEKLITFFANQVAVV